MQRCEAKRGGNCGRSAIWKQRVHAGDREAGRFLFDAYWCGEHAERVAQRRAKNNAPPAEMTPVGAEEGRGQEQRPC